ncbi:hypothetical protein QL285_060692 [Trifolium repens]|nr:hypothetical protein QL285_060692 [Trifolium repens]
MHELAPSAPDPRPAPLRQKPQANLTSPGGLAPYPAPPPFFCTLFHAISKAIFNRNHGGRIHTCRLQHNNCNFMRFITIQVYKMMQNLQMLHFLESTTNPGECTLQPHHHCIYQELKTQMKQQ